MSQLTQTITAGIPEVLAPVVRAMPDLAVFNMAWSAPEELIPVCDALGFETLADLQAWVARVNTALGVSKDAFVKLCRPEPGVSRDGLVIAPFSTIHQAISAQCVLRSDIFVEQFDAAFMLPTKTQWDTIAANSPMRRHDWRESRNDCDDRVKWFLGWLAEYGLGNFAAGFCGLTMYDSAGEIVGGHAVALVCDADHKVWFLEPADGKLYPPTTATLGGIAGSTVKIARVWF